MFCASLVVTAQERAFSVVGVGARPAALGGSFVALQIVPMPSLEPGRAGSIKSARVYYRKYRFIWFGVQANWFSLAKSVGDNIPLGLDIQV